MKEAAGEANLTVITIILIGIIVAVATPIITSMMRNTAMRGCCQNYGGVWHNGNCHSITATGARGSQISAGTYWNSTSNSCR